MVARCCRGMGWHRSWYRVGTWVAALVSNMHGTVAVKQNLTQPCSFLTVNTSYQYSGLGISCPISKKLKAIKLKQEGQLLDKISWQTAAGEETYYLHLKFDHLAPSFIAPSSHLQTRVNHQEMVTEHGGVQSPCSENVLHMHRASQGLHLYWQQLILRITQRNSVRCLREE